LILKAMILSRLDLIFSEDLLRKCLG